MKLLALLSLSILISCSEPEYQPTVFSIDRGSLDVRGDTVIASGYVGPNGCYRYHHREISETDSTVILKYFGIHNEPPGTACTQVIIGFADTVLLSAGQRHKRLIW